MKALSIASALFAAVSLTTAIAAAHDPTPTGGAIRPNEYRCHDLQAKLQNEGSLWLRSSIGLPYMTVMDCGSAYIPRADYRRTLDVSSCFVGYICQSPPNDNGGGGA